MQIGEINKYDLTNPKFAAINYKNNKYIKKVVIVIFMEKVKKRDHASVYFIVNKDEFVSQILSRGYGSESYEWLINDIPNLFTYF